MAMELLIKPVRENPAIYNKEHSDYKDQSGVVANIWLEISTSLHEEGHTEFIGRCCYYY